MDTFQDHNAQGGKKQASEEYIWYDYIVKCL